jgi:hypothetical protein
VTGLNYGCPSNNKERKETKSVETSYPTVIIDDVFLVRHHESHDE